jgi:alpha-galactosidase
MCSGDTIGPGGIFRAMRELPVILKVARDVKELCPDAWLINYINPTTVNGIGLMRHAPGVKSFALCDGHHMPHLKRYYLVACGIAKNKESVTPEMEAKLDVRIGGVNHFTWVLGLSYDGRDLVPIIRRDLERAAAKERDEGHSKAKFNARYGLALWDLFGVQADNLGHTKEYVPFWQGKNVAKEKLPPLTIFDAKGRQKIHDAMWKEIDGYLSGTLAPAEFVKKYGPDHATDIIESMWGGLGKQFYINQPNRGAIANMDDDAFFELLSDVDMNGPRPLPVGSFPLGVRALTQQVLETHELTVEAIVKCDRAVLRRAMLLDPIVNSISDADKIIAELLRAERDALPKGWFR